jgi:hypothetical protein
MIAAQTGLGLARRGTVPPRCASLPLSADHHRESARRHCCISGANTLRISCS